MKELAIRIQKADRTDADGSQPDGGQVQFLVEPLPAEDPQAEEGGFEEESGQTFDRQGGTEDIPHEA